MGPTSSGKLKDVMLLSLISAALVLTMVELTNANDLAMDFHDLGPESCTYLA